MRGSAIPATTNRFPPIGGVVSDISMLMTKSTPSTTGSNPLASSAATAIGTSTNIMLIVSITQPRSRNTDMITSSRVIPSNGSA